MIAMTVTIDLAKDLFQLAIAALALPRVRHAVLPLAPISVIGCNRRKMGDK